MDIPNKLKRLITLLYDDFRRDYLGQIFPIAPRVLNLLVNDICNSHCKMCNVWKQKRDKEFTPDELADILKDPLFKNLRYIGVSGGEPTLRSDLHELFKAIIGSSPKLKGAGIITNGLNENDVLSKILLCDEICRHGNMPFNVMVSMDGIGETHDLIRGKQHNFKSVVSLIRYLRNKTDIPISVGCTIIKDNVWEVDDVLDFCRREKVYVRFRIAEFIDRLYNAEQTEIIRNFSELETYHLGLFFAKLQYTYETSPIVRLTYQNIRRMLMEGASRTIGCLWQNQAVTLNCRGQLLYCSPQSPVLENCCDESAQKIYLRNISTRRAVLKNDCRNCIHDYMANDTFPQWYSRWKDNYWRIRLSLPHALKRTSRTKVFSAKTDWRRICEHFLIIGWYGTETAGDKAILGGIVQQLKQDFPRASITLSSLFPYVSLRTVKELGYTNIKVIPVYSPMFWRETSKAHEIIMGGGPLMHLEQLGVVLTAFDRAKRAGNKTRIMGCGIGPLDKGKKYVEGVRRILLRSDKIELRDTASVRLAEKMTGRKDVFHSGDYAVGFVNQWMGGRSEDIRRKPLLNLYLRELTTEYQSNCSDDHFKEMKKAFEEQLGLWIHEICREQGLRPHLLPMHHFCIGGDDRAFNRHFAQTYLVGLDPLVERRPLSVNEILASMQEATLSLCMRFHSVLFAHTLGVPFYGLDYTGGGKIYNYMLDHSIPHSMINIQDISHGKWRDMGMDS